MSFKVLLQRTTGYKDARLVLRVAISRLEGHLVA